MDSNDFTTTDEFTDDSSISSTATFNFTINSTPTINSTINSTATINSTINSTITFNNESTTAFNPIENLYDHTPLFVFIFGSFGVGGKFMQNKDFFCFGMRNSLCLYEHTKKFYQKVKIKALWYKNQNKLILQQFYEYCFENGQFW